MPLTKFRVGPHKAIRLAECAAVPRVMVIAGPNGAGKSTLLDLLRRKQGTTFSEQAKVIYQNPHRAIRRTQVRRRFVFGGAVQPFTDILAQNDTPQFEGLSISGTSRTPDTVDEAGSTVKFTLSRVENRRQTAQSDAVDRARSAGGGVDPKELPDVYEPLRELTKHLLPHLKFKAVDVSNDDNIRALWTRKDGAATVEIDLDDFSSGEKNIILLFLPLVEREMYRRLRHVTTGKAEVEPAADLVFIVDEPELHLHPDLQSKILAYMRAASKEDGVQFIVSTHSPTLLDQAYDEELYLLLPPADESGGNQLKKVATNLEKLEALRSLAGSTFALTTGRSIVCVEGGPVDGNEPADVGMFQILYPRATAFTFLPSGGKAQVIRTVLGLRENLPKEHFGIEVFGLVDADQNAGEAAPAGVVQLPVAMIENLLLEAGSLHQYLTKKGIKTFADGAGVEGELRGIALQEREEEVRLRVGRALRPRTVRVSGSDVATVRAAHAAEVAAVQGLLPADPDLNEIVASCGARVDKILAEGTELKLFAGKSILRKFYQRHIAPANISYKEFCYELAQSASKAAATAKLLDPVFDKLK